MAPSEEDAVIRPARLQFGSRLHKFLIADHERITSLAAVEAFEQAAEKKPQHSEPFHLKIRQHKVGHKASNDEA